MIAALARKLLIGLWRFVTTGELLEGAVRRLCRPRPAAEVPKVSPGSAGELELSADQNLSQRRHVNHPEEGMPYRISYIDTSMSTDEQQTTGRLRTEEFPTEPAALARARELLEDVSYKTILISEIPTSTWGQPMRR